MEVPRVQGSPLPRPEEDDSLPEARGRAGTVEARASIITDEISQDPETSVELAVRWEIKRVDIGVWGKRAPDIDNGQRNMLIDTLERYGVNVMAISPGAFAFKVPAS